MNGSGSTPSVEEQLAAATKEADQERHRELLDDESAEGRLKDRNSLLDLARSSFAAKANADLQQTGGTNPAIGHGILSSDGFESLIPTIDQFGANKTNYYRVRLSKSQQFGAILTHLSSIERLQINSYAAHSKEYDAAVKQNFHAPTWLLRRR